jgi:hypothetical protein
VRLQLSHRQQTFDVKARVISSHPGMGMGLIFEGLGPKQTMLLVEWLSQRAPSLDEELSESEEPSANPETPGSDDRELILKLLRSLDADGKLMQGQVSVLLSDPMNL